MKKIKYVCDKCLKTVRVQIAIRNEALEECLYPMGYQEWCYSCMNPDLFIPGQKPLITEDPKEIERYGKL